MPSYFEVKVHHTLNILAFHDFPSFIIISLGLLPEVWQSITPLLWPSRASWTRFIMFVQCLWSKSCFHVEEKFSFWEASHAVSQEPERQWIGHSFPPRDAFLLCLSQGSLARYLSVWLKTATAQNVVPGEVLAPYVRTEKNVNFLVPPLDL